MKTLHTLLIYLLAFAIAAATLSSCGDKEENKPASTTSFNFEPIATEIAEGDTVTLTLKVTDPGNNLKAIKVMSNGNPVKITIKKSGQIMTSDGNGIVLIDSLNGQTVNVKTVAPQVQADSMITYAVALYGDVAATNKLTEKSADVMIKNGTAVQVFSTSPVKDGDEVSVMSTINVVVQIQDPTRRVKGLIVKRDGLLLTGMASVTVISGVGNNPMPIYSQQDGVVKVAYSQPFILNVITTSPANPGTYQYSIELLDDDNISGNVLATTSLTITVTPPAPNTDTYNDRELGSSKCLGRKFF